MAVWFNPNTRLNFGHWDYFSDNPGLGFEGRYSGQFWFQDGWKCRDFCYELFFGTIFGPSFRTA